MDSDCAVFTSVQISRAFCNSHFIQNLTLFIAIEIDLNAICVSRTCCCRRRAPRSRDSALARAPAVSRCLRHQTACTCIARARAWGSRGEEWFPTKFMEEGHTRHYPFGSSKNRIAVTFYLLQMSFNALHKRSSAPHRQRTCLN
jgi:hypothetical protein